MDKLKAYLDKEPEIVFEWHDDKTEAVGWLVINSLRNGAAGGGTRMRKGLTKDEVLALAKVMEVKFSVSGPAIGGAKSGINFDPDDPRKDEVLKRWFTAAFPLLSAYYGTGGDLNVDEIRDVIPITGDLGLLHPQEGVVNGYFGHTGKVKGRVIHQLDVGCEKVIKEEKYAPQGKNKIRIADMVTGFGVSESIRHFYDLQHQDSLEGKRVIVQGWGNVGAAAAFNLAKAGAIIVGIVDKDGGLINEQGMNLDEIKELFLNKQGNKLVSPLKMPFDIVNSKIWDVPTDIFIPAAASRLVNKSQVDRLITGGMKVFACGANVPFVDDEVFYGPTAQYADGVISLIPDFIANSGMARTFAYLMEEHKEITADAIFKDVSKTIRQALEKALIRSKDGIGITRSAFHIAMQYLSC